MDASIFGFFLLDDDDDEMMPLLNPGVFIDMGDFIAEGKLGNEPNSDDDDDDDDDDNDDDDDDDGYLHH